MLHEISIGGDKFIVIHGPTPEIDALDLSNCGVF